MTGLALFHRDRRQVDIVFLWLHLRHSVLRQKTSFRFGRKHWWPAKAICHVSYKLLSPSRHFRLDYLFLLANGRSIIPLYTKILFALMTLVLLLSVPAIFPKSVCRASMSVYESPPLQLLLNSLNDVALLDEPHTVTDRKLTPFPPIGTFQVGDEFPTMFRSQSPKTDRRPEPTPFLYSSATPVAYGLPPPLRLFLSQQDLQRPGWSPLRDTSIFHRPAIILRCSLTPTRISPMPTSRPTQAQRVVFFLCTATSPSPGA